MSSLPRWRFAPPSEREPRWRAAAPALGIAAAVSPGRRPRLARASTRPRRPAAARLPGDGERGRARSRSRERGDGGAAAHRGAAPSRAGGGARGGGGRRPAAGGDALREHWRALGGGGVNDAGRRRPARGRGHARRGARRGACGNAQPRRRQARAGRARRPRQAREPALLPGGGPRAGVRSSASASAATRLRRRGARARRPARPTPRRPARPTPRRPRRAPTASRRRPGGGGPVPCGLLLRAVVSEPTCLRVSAAAELLAGPRRARTPLSTGGLIAAKEAASTAAAQHAGRRAAAPNRALGERGRAARAARPGRRRRLRRGRRRRGRPARRARRRRSSPGGGGPRRSARCPPRSAAASRPRRPRWRGARARPPSACRGRDDRDRREFRTSPADEAEAPSLSQVLHGLRDAGALSAATPTPRPRPRARRRAARAVAPGSTARRAADDADGGSELPRGRRGRARGALHALLPATSEQWTDVADAAAVAATVRAAAAARAASTRGSSRAARRLSDMLLRPTPTSARAAPRAAAPGRRGRRARGRAPPDADVIWKGAAARRQSAHLPNHPPNLGPRGLCFCCVVSRRGRAPRALRFIDRARHPPATASIAVHDPVAAQEHRGAPRGGYGGTGETAHCRWRAKGERGRRAGQPRSYRIGFPRERHLWRRPSPNRRPRGQNGVGPHRGRAVPVRGAARALTV